MELLSRRKFPLFWAHVICVLVYSSSESVSAYLVNASEGEFPSIVYIETESSGNLITRGCTGTLLSLQWVLTGGACIGNHTISNLKIIAGLAHIGKQGINLPGVQVRSVGREVFHVDMSGVSRDSYNLQPYPDITLLRTTIPFLLDRLVAPTPIHACKIKASLTSSKDCVVAGWGYEESNPESHYLKWANVLEVMAYPDCLQYGLLEYDSQICAALPTDTPTLKGFCGNPIYRKGSLYGIHHSRTYYRNELFRIEVFIDISNFLPWITQYVKELKMREHPGKKRASSANKYMAGVASITAVMLLHCVHCQ